MTPALERAGPRVPPELLDVLRCPACRAAFVAEGAPPGGLCEGRLTCGGCGAAAPVRDGIVRLGELAGGRGAAAHERTREAFSLEWSLYRPRDGTWGMTMEERTQWFFLHGTGLDASAVAGLRVLDAGCGNGSSTLGMARLGAHCVGIEQSRGVERAGLHFTPADAGLPLAYVQGNLLDAPFAPESFDVVFAAGVLHHTPETRQAFRALAPLVRSGGRFYVWLYRHEPKVTPVVNAIRRVTTRLPPRLFLALAMAGAPAFQAFTWLMDRSGARAYRPLPWRASALALVDIFGAPFAHAHTPEEVEAWFAEAGFDTPRAALLERRGFSLCGIRRRAA